jgi:hypothetical protein
MVMRTRIVLLGCFILASVFQGLWAPVEAHETNVHEAITDRALDFLAQYKTPDNKTPFKACGLPEVRDPLKLGVTREDDFITRLLGNFLFHFYPTLKDDFRTNLPILSDPNGGNEQDLSGTYEVEGSCNSAQWGFDNTECKGSLKRKSTTGIAIEDRLPLRANTHAYSKVIAQLRSSAGTPAFLKLVGVGHFLHLLQDLTSPAHVTMTLIRT